jgi:hypothetical protein
MRIRLSSNWDWPVPGSRAVMAFRAGDYTVTREQGEAAIAAGVGSELPSGTTENAPKKTRRSRASN